MKQVQFSLASSSKSSQKDSSNQITQAKGIIDSIENRLQQFLNKKKSRGMESPYSSNPIYEEPQEYNTQIQKIEDIQLNKKLQHLSNEIDELKRQNLQLLKEKQSLETLISISTNNFNQEIEERLSYQRSVLEQEIKNQLEEKMVAQIYQKESPRSKENDNLQEILDEKNKLKMELDSVKEQNQQLQFQFDELKNAYESLLNQKREIQQQNDQQMFYQNQERDYKQELEQLKINSLNIQSQMQKQIDELQRKLQEQQSEQKETSAKLQEENNDSNINNLYQNIFNQPSQDKEEKKTKAKKTKQKSYNNNHKTTKSNKSLKDNEEESNYNKQIEQFQYEVTRLKELVNEKICKKKDKKRTKK